MQERTVDCMQKIPILNDTTNITVGFNDTVVQDDLCSNISMPARVKMCNSHIPCPRRWQPSGWGPVSIVSIII